MSSIVIDTSKFLVLASRFSLLNTFPGTSLYPFQAGLFSFRLGVLFLLLFAVLQDGHTDSLVTALLKESFLT